MKARSSKIPWSIISEDKLRREDERFNRGRLPAYAPEHREPEHREPERGVVEISTLGRSRTSGSSRSS